MRNSTKKKFSEVKAPMVAENGKNNNPKGYAKKSKDMSYDNSPGTSEGQLHGRPMEPYADPMNDGVVAKIGGIEGLHNDIGESSGFITDGYIDKGGTPFGEAAKFNFLPPGMDISNQENAEIHTMPLKKIVSESYPGDGWMPAPRDIPE